MRPDVTALAHFYRTSIGRGAAFGIAEQVKKLWPTLSSLEVLGIGYPLPIFDALLPQGAELLAFMPAAQGVTYWPDKAFGRTALVDEEELPLEDDVMDRIILLHGLEFSPHPARLLREVWRVLKPGGKVLLIVPNRRRIWSTLDTTPFGQGNPYSKSQLYNLLMQQLLPPLGATSALMVPPFKVLGIESMIKLGEVCLCGFARQWGGVLMVEAEKQVYGAITADRRVKQTVPAISGINC